MRRDAPRNADAPAGRPTLGANRTGGGTTFEVWAEGATVVELVLEGGAGSGTGEAPGAPPPRPAPAADRGPARVLRMERTTDGYFGLTVDAAPPGTRYRYRVDGRGPFPDPASRFQPDGVHGPSMVVDPAAFRWTDARWNGVALADTVLYELHVGAFTPEGTFRAALRHLPRIRDLGATAIELMPVADFAGDRNWGYDGVALFAPARCYGTPDDLRALVDAAHMIGLAVHLDVVYNHLGPDGAYHAAISPHYIARSHASAWGDAFNLDGPYSGEVRACIAENARRWILEYHLDGLRLDATHAFRDASPRHIVTEVADAARAAARSLGREALVIAEDARNLRSTLEPASRGGWGVDGTWSDDFHHQMRRALAGDADGYFADFTGAAADIATTINDGWYFRGQPSTYFGGARGTDPTGFPRERFVFFLQNHDQVGNRAAGDRLHQAIEAAAWRAASALLLLAPETPLLFMGQEWGASAPFPFFTDHHADLGAAVTEGRRREFARFAAFADPARREAIPDPQDPATFARAKLDWSEPDREPHRSLLRLVRRLLKLRRLEAALRRPGTTGDRTVQAYNDDVLFMRREAPEAGGRHLLAVVRLRGDGEVSLRDLPASRLVPGRRWTAVLTTEHALFAPDPARIAIDRKGPRLRFSRPGAVVFVSRPDNPRSTPVFGREPERT